jgi:hypothetical protein
VKKEKEKEKDEIVLSYVVVMKGEDICIQMLFQENE